MIDLTPSPLKRSTFTHRLCRKAISWKHLVHPNVRRPVPFAHSLRVTPNGNVMVYARSNPEATRLRMVGPLGISSRSPPPQRSKFKALYAPLPRSQVKRANVLIDNAGTACVAEFGLMVIADLSTILLSETTVSCGGAFRWMRPELLDPEHFGSNGRPTCESVRHALGMVIYEMGLLYSSQ